MFTAHRQVRLVKSHGDRGVVERPHVELLGLPSSLIKRMLIDILSNLPGDSYVISPFLVMTCFLVWDYNIQPKKELHRSLQVVGALEDTREV